MGARLLNFKPGVSQEDHRWPIQTPADGAAINPIGGIVFLGTGVDATLTPRVGQTYIFHCTDSTADATVTLGGGFVWDASNNDIATFDATGDILMVIFGTTTLATVIANPGALSFSGA
jgi:hypothetical protein